MELVDIDIKEFKEIIYPEYLKLFPACERKSYARIEKTYKDKIVDIIKMVDNDRFVGFLLVNTLKDSKYVLLDFLATLPEYQGCGYGSKALRLLKQRYNKYKGIFIEVEKAGLGENDDENSIREKRIKFYESAGCYNMNINIVMYDVIYTAFMLPCIDKEILNSEVLDEIFKIYIAVSDQKSVNDNIRIM